MTELSPSLEVFIDKDTNKWIKVVSIDHDPDTGTTTMLLNNASLPLTAPHRLPLNTILLVPPGHISPYCVAVSFGTHTKCNWAREAVIDLEGDLDNINHVVDSEDDRIISLLCIGYLGHLLRTEPLAAQKVFDKAFMTRQMMALMNQLGSSHYFDFRKTNMLLKKTYVELPPRWEGDREREWLCKYNREKTSAKRWMTGYYFSTIAGKPNGDRLKRTYTRT